MEGTVLAGKYRIESLLGKGGMGSVWRAQHLELAAPVAVKLMEFGASLDQGLLVRFQHEARAAAALRSPHVVQILDFGVDPQISAPFIVMELLEGEPLSKRLGALGRLSPHDTARILTQVGRALARAHEAGIVHRDLKPDNIFLVRNGDEEVVKVLDFGIAKSAAPLGGGVETRTGTVMGTPFYMSPEQIGGAKNVDSRSDLWSLGVIAFECLTGLRPFQADTIGGLVLKICAEPLPQPSACAPIPPAFDAWFARSSARDPAQRFQSVQELTATLCEVCGVNLGPSSGAAVQPAPWVPSAQPSSVASHYAQPSHYSYAPHSHAPPAAAQHGSSQHGSSQHGSSQHGSSQHGSSQHTSAVHAHAPMSLLDMVVYPFRDKQWPSRLIWLALLDYVPVLNVIVLRGWRLEVARRFARGQSPVLPELDRIMQFIGQGLLLWFMTFLYSLVPLAIIVTLGWGGILGFWGDMWDLSKLIWGGASLAQVAEFTVRELASSFFAALVDSIWLIISLPLYRAAMIRYAATGYLSSFFDVLGSLQYILAFPGTFAKLYLYSFLLGGFISVASMLLLLTGVGAVIVPLVSLPVYYWTTAAEYGHMGHEYLQYLGRDKLAAKGQVTRSLLVAAATVVLAGTCSVSGVGRDQPAVSSGCGRAAGGLVARASADDAPSQSNAASFANPGSGVGSPAGPVAGGPRPPSAAAAAAIAAPSAGLPATGALLDSYYADLNANRFEASRYFEPSVERYITMQGTSTAKINDYIHRVFPTQFKQHHFSLEPESLSLEGPGTYTYVERSSYYLVAKKKQLEQRYMVRIRVSPGGKITFLQQFQRLPPAPSSGPVKLPAPL